MKIQHKRILKITLFIGAIVIFYSTGLNNQILALVQRGMLKTGIFNPKIEYAQETTDASENELTKADFEVQFYNEQDELVSLKTFSGKPIFMNFWATWCAPCIAEMPGIANLYSDKNKDVNFVLVSFDTDFQKARDFKAKKGYTFPIYRVANDLPEMYNTGSLPTTIFIDAQGNLALTHMGMADYDTQDFRSYLDSLK